MAEFWPYMKYNKTNRLSTINGINQEKHQTFPNGINQEKHQAFLSKLT